MKYFVFTVMLCSLVSCFSKEPERTPLKGKTMPSFKLFLVDSTTYFDTKDIPTGKPTILLYFGPHCPYSRAQIEEIINHIKDLKEIDIYLFTTWSFRELKFFYSEYRLQNYRNIIAGVDYTNFFVNHFGVPGVPYMAIYGRDKKLKEAFVGNVESSQIKSIIKD